MFNFIICDDDATMLKKLKASVQAFMMKKDFPYKIYGYADYDEEFLKVISRKLENKIYILDIETPTRTGLDIARIIRMKDNDSAIIFITGHDELGPRLLSKDITFLAFINKFDNCMERLHKNLEKSVKALEKRKSLKLEDRGVFYSIHLDDILYITRDRENRKTVIKTDSNEFKLYMSAAKLVELLDERFIQTLRGYYVNKDRVNCVNKKQKLIIFDNGLELKAISSKFSIKELIK